jgi:hypothetical protein
MKNDGFSYNIYSHNKEVIAEHELNFEKEGLVNGDVFEPLFYL